MAAKISPRLSRDAPLSLASKESLVSIVVVVGAVVNVLLLHMRCFYSVPSSLPSLLVGSVL